jgi:hopanoid biosynthesis associated protein HpnK
MRRLIVTADDFGADEAVNEAVESAHVDGILTAASLMVTGAAVADAVSRARHLPKLGVGLHIVLVEGRPALPPEQIPDLVDGEGHFRTNMVRAGIDIFFCSKVRRQLAAEIEAQFTAFAATGLPLDHVNAHKHFHLHPTIAELILNIGPGYGMRAVRAPVEPAAIINAIEPSRASAADWIANSYARRMQSRLRRTGMLVPDQVFGLAWSGAMDTARLGALVERLPAGLSEIYCHPATRDDFPGHAPGYRYRDELSALLATNLNAVEPGSFAAFAA